MSIRIAVTGKSGQVVRALFEAAGDEKDFTVIPVGRPELDLTDSKTIYPALEKARPDVIVSAAAYTEVDRAETEIEIAALINAEGPSWVARAASRLGVPLIHLSTDYVFDGEKKIYFEEDRANPKSVYGMTKWVGERAVLASADNSVVLRTSWVYAPYGKNFVRTMLRLAATKPVLRVVGDQFGTPTYAPDLAKAIFGLARNLLAYPDNPALRGLYHFSGGGVAISWADFAREILIYLGSKGFPKTPPLYAIRSEEYPTLAPRPANSWLSCDKIFRMHRILHSHWRPSLIRALDLLTSTEKLNAP
jgi:dTDP-4-dehydrorhamnose reductase